MPRREVLGTCHHDCPDSCGWVVTVDDGVAVRLRGNPDHPYSRGELCPKVNRFLDRVHHPDRILTPLLRTGPKGSGRFAPTSWDEALARTAEGLRAVIDRWGGEAVLPWSSAGTQGLLQMSSLDRRFFARLGSSRLTGSLCGATAAAGVALTNGTPLGADPLDVVHAQLVLLWGTNTRLTNRHLWPFVEEARGRGATVVVIDPVRTATAASADRFVQPLPGTDVALVLAMAHVLIRDDLVDHGFVAAETTGFDELAAHVADWTPARAADVCGVGADEVEWLAHAYGTTRPAMIRTLIGAEHHERGATTYRALACLPALTGSWRDRGGGLARSVGSWNDVDVDDSVFDAPHLAGGRPRRGINMNHLGRALTDPDLDPPIGALVVWNGNPAVTVPDAGRIRRGLLRDDLFCVVSEQLLTDTARHADVVFPAATQIEQLDVVPAWGHLYLGWNEPAIAPLGESVPNTELWRRLAAAMGFTEPELFESDESLLAAALPRVDLTALRERGFVRLSVPDHVRPGLDGWPTPSGRIQLAGGAAEALGLGRVPTYEPAAEGPAGDHPDHPLVLLTPKAHPRFLNSSYSSHHGPLERGPHLELDPADAAERGLGDGDPARVWNRRGELVLPVVLSDRLRPGVAAVPFGWWGEHHGGGATANALTSDVLTDHGGGVAYGDTRVQVERAPLA